MGRGRVMSTEKTLLMVFLALAASGIGSAAVAMYRERQKPESERRFAFKTELLMTGLVALAAVIVWWTEAASLPIGAVTK